MEVWYYDVAEMPKSVTETLDAKTCKSLEELVGGVDVVVLCAPAIPGATSALIAEKELGFFRQGGRFVNVARGSLVDEEAVADALDSGKLSSVALDVHPNEPVISERLREHAKRGRAMLTCHNAGGTVETHIGFEELSMRNIMAVLSGQMAITPVNMQHLR
jgi:lactate dehydrogenase-like 2-hydroxyacid dehydrogenase